MAFLNKRYLHSAIGTRIKVFSIPVVLALIIGVQIERIDLGSKILSVISSVSANYSFSIIIVAASIIILCFLLLIHNAVYGKPRTAVGLFILFLPLMSLFRRYGGVTIHTNPAETIVVSLSTFSLFLLGIIFHLRGIKIRKSEDSTFRLFKKLLWLFALTGSAIQIFHYSLNDALWVSIDGLWQFVVWFYIITAVIESYDDLRYLTSFIIGSLILGVLLTLVNVRSIETYFSDNFATKFSFVSSTVGMVAIYSLMVTVLALYMVRSTDSTWKRVFWLIMAFVLIGVVLLTQTRSAFVASILIGLLLIYKSERRWFFISIVPVFLLGIVLHEQIGTILSYNPLSTDLMSIGSVTARFEVWKESIPITFSRAWLGFGIGNTPLIMEIQGLYVNSHHLIFYLMQDVGVIATVVFLLLFSFTIWQLLKVSLSKNSNSQQGNIAAYIMIALLIWFWYAVTGGLGITTHGQSGTHTEDTMLFYTYLFLGWAAIRLARKKGSETVVEIKT